MFSLFFSTFVMHIDESEKERHMRAALLGLEEWTQLYLQGQRQLWLRLAVVAVVLKFPEMLKSCLLLKVATDTENGLSEGPTEENCRVVVDCILFLPIQRNPDRIYFTGF